MQEHTIPVHTAEQQYQRPGKACRCRCRCRWKPALQRGKTRKCELLQISPAETLAGLNA